MQNEPTVTPNSDPQQRVINYRPERPGLEFQRQDVAISTIAPILTRSNPVVGSVADAPVADELVNELVAVSTVQEAPTADVSPNKSFKLWQAALLFVIFVVVAFGAFMAYNALIA